MKDPRPSLTSSLVTAFAIGACGEAEPFEPPAQLDRPVAATLFAFGQNSALFGELAAGLSQVIYRGEGDAPMVIEGTNGAYPFRIEHPRYELWVVCENSGALRLLALGAEDTSAPVVRCPIAVDELGLPELRVSIGDTPPGQAARIAVGPTMSAFESVQGATVTLSMFRAEPGPVDLVTLLRDEADALALKVQRDLRIEGEHAVSIDFSDHAPVLVEPIVRPDRDVFLRTFLLTENQTMALLHESRTSSIGAAPDEIFGDGDIYAVQSTRVVSNDGRASQLFSTSYRVDPREANTATPLPYAAASLRFDSSRRALLDLPERSQAQATTAVLLTAGGGIEVLISETWLAEASSFDLNPPVDFEPTWSLGEVGDDYWLGLSSASSGRSDPEFLEQEIFRPLSTSPRARAGMDVQVTFDEMIGRIN